MSRQETERTKAEPQGPLIVEDLPLGQAQQGEVKGGSTQSVGGSGTGKTISAGLLGK
jgi:hypothetical protein